MAIGLGGRTALVAVVAGTLLLGPGPRSRAEQARHVLVVGPTDGYGALVGGVSEGLQSAGFAEPARIRVDIRNARSAAEAKASIGAADDAGVDAIVTIFGPSTQAARAATTTVPIVFCPVADPVAAKLVASNEAPGGHLTGVASADAEASRRRLAAFRQVLPELKRLAVLFDQGFPPDRVQLANLEHVAPAIGVTLVTRAVADEDAAVAALRSLGRTDVDAVLVLKEALLRRASEEVGRSSRPFAWFGDAWAGTEGPPGRVVPALTRGRPHAVGATAPARHPQHRRGPGRARGAPDRRRGALRRLPRAERARRAELRPDRVRARGAGALRDRPVRPGRPEPGHLRLADFPLRRHGLDRRRDGRRRRARARRGVPRRRLGQRHQPRDGRLLQRPGPPPRGRNRRDAGPGREQRRRRDLDRLHAPLRACHAGPGAGGAREGLRPGGSRPRRDAPRRGAEARPAQRDLAFRDPGDGRILTGDPHRGLAELPRPLGPAPDALVGEHAERGADLSRDRAVDLRVPGHRHHAERARVQPDRRRPARHPRP